MKSKISREEALALLQKYNKEPFHILHGLTVEASACCMILILNCIQKSIV